MHEMAVCNELIDQVRANAVRHHASGVGTITVRIGALSGVEPDLLEHAFMIARAGKYTAEADLVVETIPVRVRCRACNNENETSANRLLCNACGGYAIDLVGGDELLLASIELRGVSSRSIPSRATNSDGEDSHV